MMGARLSRISATVVPGWIVIAGPASTTTGMQGGPKRPLFMVRKPVNEPCCFPLTDVAGK